MCNTLNIKALELYCNIKKWNIELDTLIDKLSFVVHLRVGTVFQTATYFMFVIPRLRPGLLSLRSVLSSRQTPTNWTKKKYQ